MFSKSMQAAISRLVLSSFLFLNIHSTAVAVEEMEVLVQPRIHYFQDDALGGFIEQVLLPQKHVSQKPQGEQQEAIARLTRLLQTSWTIEVVKHVSDQVVQTVQQVFTPYLALCELLQKSAEELQERLAQPLQLADFCEEKKILDLGDAWQAEVAWDGNIKISKKQKDTSRLHVQSLTDVILDNVQATDLSISAPSVSLTGEASIDHLAIHFDEDDAPAGVAKTSTFVLGTAAQLTTQDLEMNGLLLNKGTIDLKDPASLQVHTLVNTGAMQSSGHLTITADALLRNSGHIEAADLSLKANILQQTAIADAKPLIKAGTLQGFTAETLTLGAGSLEADHIDLTSLGAFTNAAEIKAKELLITAQAPLTNEGLFDVEALDLKAYDALQNTGVIRTKETHLALEPHAVFEQNGVFHTQVLRLEGNQSVFRNTQNLTVSELQLCRDIQFENHTPLTEDELAGKEEPAVRATLERVQAETGRWTNTGFLTVSHGTLPSLQNQGVLVAEKLELAQLQQSGKMRATQMTITQDAVNTGDLCVSALAGSGTFQQSGHLVADQDLDVSIQRFEQKKVTTEPRLEAKKATFSSPFMRNGENCHWLVESQTVAPGTAPLENEGILKATDLYVARSVRNDGTIACETFNGKGRLENNDTLQITKAATVDCTELNQNGTFEAGEITGKIQKFTNAGSSKVGKSRALTVSKMQIGRDSVYESSGQTLCDDFENRGHFIWKGGEFRVRNTYQGTEDSVETLSGDFHVTAGRFAHKGWVEASSIRMTSDTKGQEFGKLRVQGNAVYAGAAAADSLQNTDFQASKISGGVAIDAPQQAIEITKPVSLPCALKIHAKSITQTANIQAQTLALQAEKLDSRKRLLAKGGVDIAADVIDIHGTVASTEGHITLRGFQNSQTQRVYNSGSVVTGVTMQSASSYRASKRLPHVEAKNVTLGTTGQLSAPYVDLTGRNVANSGLIEASKTLMIKVSGRAQNSGTIQSETLTLTTLYLHNSGTIHGNQGSEFTVRSRFEETESSSIVLDHARLTLPGTRLALKGTLQVTHPRWKVANAYGSSAIAEHAFEVGPRAKLILRDYAFKWSDFKNYGTFELHDSKGIGSGTYYAGPQSVTVHSDNLYAQRFEAYGLTRVNGGIRLTCPSTSCHFGRYEVTGDLEFVVPAGVPDMIAVQNLMTFDLENSKVSPGRRFYIDAPSTNITLRGNLKFGGRMEMRVRSLTNSGTLSSHGLKINASQEVKNTGLMYSGDSLDVFARTFCNSDNGQVAAKYPVNIQTDYDLSNSSVARLWTSPQSENARIFSEYSDVTLHSRYGNVQNTFASLQAFTSFDIEAAKTIDNTGGLLYASDRYSTSRFKAQCLINSCKWTSDPETRYRSEQESYYETKFYDGVNAGTIFTFGLYRPTRTKQVLAYRTVQRPYTVYEPHARSIPGEIFLGGEVSFDVPEYHIDGGTFMVGGRIYNPAGQTLNLQARQIGPYCGLVQAYSADLSVQSLQSRGGQFRIGSGGLCLRSNGVITFVSAEKNRSIQLQTVVSAVDYSHRYGSLFGQNTDGSVHVRFPETETLRWNTAQTIATKNLRPERPVKFMISPEAFMRSLSLMPVQEVGIWPESPQVLFTLLQKNAEDAARNRVISQEEALRSTVPMLLWDVRERDGVQELYPVLIFPQTLQRITDDVYSEGNIYLSARGALKLEQAQIHAREEVVLESDVSITQKGGQIVSETAIVTEAPHIYHEICKETLASLEKSGNTTTYTRQERVTDVPVLQAPVIVEKGNVTATAVQIQGDTYEHSDGKLRIQPAVLNAKTHTISHEKKRSSEMTIRTQAAVPAQIQVKNAHFHGDTELIGTVAQIENTNKHARLTLGAQVLTNAYEGTAKKSGFFRSSTVYTNGTHQQALPTILEGNVLRDLDAHGGPLIMRSSILKVLDQEVTNELLQETEMLKHEDFTKTKTSGWNLPWFDDPRPALVRSLEALVNASTAADRTTAGLQSTTNALRLINDAAHLISGPKAYVPTLLYGIANKMASLSYGTTTTKEWVQKEIPALNNIEAKVLRIKNPKTHLEGPVHAGLLQIETEELTAKAPAAKVQRKVESHTTTISLNPAQLATSGVLGLLPTISHAESTSKTTELHPTDLPIIADTILLKVGNLAFTGAQLSARVVDAIVNGTMTVEALQEEIITKSEQSAWNTSLGTLGAALGSAVGAGFGATASHKGFDAFMHRINQSPLPLIPSFRSEDRQHVEKFVQHMARFVGEEQFTLKVGKALIKRAADVGLSVDGVVSDSGLDAVKVINQPMHEVNIDQHNAFAIPLADALAFCGAINELTLLRRKAFETLEAQGVFHREAVAVLNDPEVKKQLEAIAETRHQILDAQLNAEEQFTKQETELVQKAAELAPEADAFALLESGSVSDFLAEENTPLEQKIALEKLCGDYAQIQEERKQTQERLGYQCVSAANCAYKKAAQLAVRHPNAAQAVFAAIGWLTETLEQYARIEGAILGATLGSATGPWGTAAGIAGGMVLMEGATKAFAGAMDEGIQRVKNYAIQLAKTETEAAEFGQAVEGLAGAGVLAFSARAGRRWLGKRRAARAARLRADASNKKPYNPREMEAMLKKNGTEVTSTTLPPKNAPNVKMAGAHKERTLVINAETQETLTQRVVFDERGFPDFRPYMQYETTISGDLGRMSTDAHMRAATRRLYSDIQAGKVQETLFNKAQLDRIKDGYQKIPGYTWHHHQDAGRMQLVPEDIHKWTGHIGGSKLWGGQK